MSARAGHGAVVAQQIERHANYIYMQTHRGLVTHPATWRGPGRRTPQRPAPWWQTADNKGRGRGGQGERDEEKSAKECEDQMPGLAGRAGSEPSQPD